MDREDKSGILDGATVNPAFKGKGIYKAMIAKRPQDARENGPQYLIIHAQKKTSAQICWKVVFRKAY
jgi:predicted GNAT family acetyltransferase